MATYGLSPNMTLYLMREYGMEMTTTSTLLFMWSATTNFMPLLGALLADSLFGRFYTIGFGSLICLVVMCLFIQDQKLISINFVFLIESNLYCY